MIVKLIILLSIIQNLEYALSTRRIAGGKLTKQDKNFMVYLLKSASSNMQLYDHWLCGGAIVTPTHVLTSAACLTDVTHVQVVAGYNKYVRMEELGFDNCTQHITRRVVKTCVPKCTIFTFDYLYLYRWGYLDIGFAIVDKPYDFDDVTIRRYCSYVPGPIKINFAMKYQETDTDAFVYGWGHNYALRMKKDRHDYNQQYLHETSTRIVDQKICINVFKNLSRTITLHLICSQGEALIDNEGNMLGPPSEGCRRSNNPAKCGDPLYYDYGFDSRRRNDNTTLDQSNTTQKALKSISNKNTTVNKTDEENDARRQGVVCQNDHGGPLVTWIGSEEYVIGTVTTGLYDVNFRCMQPQVFTSTACAGLFIKCVLHDPLYGSSNYARRFCDKLAETLGYGVEENIVNWNETDRETTPSVTEATDTTKTETENVYNYVTKGSLRINEENKNQMDELNHKYIYDNIEEVVTT